MPWYQDVSPDEEVPSGVSGVNVGVGVSICGEVAVGEGVLVGSGVNVGVNVFVAEGLGVHVAVGDDGSVPTTVGVRPAGVRVGVGVNVQVGVTVGVCVAK